MFFYTTVFYRKLNTELGSRYGVHPNQITNWKRQAIDNMAETFASKAERTRSNDDPQIKELHAKIALDRTLLGDRRTDRGQESPPGSSNHGSAARIRLTWPGPSPPLPRVSSPPDQRRITLLGI
ncbi:hypothetical protein JCM30471_25030 [Desulfuromonas carbonis]